MPRFRRTSERLARPAPLASLARWGVATCARPHTCALALACVLAFACAGRKGPPPGAPSGSAAQPDAGAAAAAPLGCAPESLAGRWLIAEGSADMHCEGGDHSAIAAGGTVDLDVRGGVPALRDGDCRYELRREGADCTWVAAPGPTCVHDGLSHRLEKLVFSHRPGAGDRAELVYGLSHPRRGRPGERCTDTTRARLVHGARAGERCLASGRWLSQVTTAGTPGEVALEVGAGTCAVRAPGYQASFACSVEGEQVVWRSALSGGDACKGETARYALSFAAECAALVLESRQEPCAVRGHAIDYLFLRRAP